MCRGKRERKKKREIERDSSHNKLCAWKSVSARRQHQQTQSSTREWPTPDIKADILVWTNFPCYQRPWAWENPPRTFSNRRTPNKGDTFCRVKKFMWESRGMLKPSINTNQKQYHTVHQHHHLHWKLIFERGPKPNALDIALRRRNKCNVESIP